MGTVRFADFTLDPANRRLSREGVPIDVNGRYFDALALLVAHPGELVTKDRFLAEVWKGVPVTDEALTQCIRALRKALGDDAGTPRFIETVPKHGYRFIAPIDGGAAAPSPDRSLDAVATIAAGTLGGGMAGLVGGVGYGLLLANGSEGGSSGAFSLLLVMAMLCALVGLLGGLGVASGIAVAGRLGGARALILGGLVGGGLVGVAGKLLSLDAFHLMLGASPGNVTGGMEGALLGAAVGLGAMLAAARRTTLGLRASLVPAALVGAATGAVLPLLGGRLMAGSLDLLSQALPASRLRFDGLVGASGLGGLAPSLFGALEAALFALFVVGGIELAARARPAR